MQCLKEKKLPIARSVLSRSLHIVTSQDIKKTIIANFIANNCHALPMWTPLHHASAMDHIVAAILLFSVCMHALPCLGGLQQLKKPVAQKELVSYRSFVKLHHLKVDC